MLPRVDAPPNAASASPACCWGCTLRVDRVLTIRERGALDAARVLDARVHRSVGDRAQRRVRPRAAASIRRLPRCGVGIVAGVPHAATRRSASASALCGAVAMAAYLLLVRASDARYTTLAVVARTYPVAAVALILAAFTAHDRWPGPTAATAWAGVLAMALVSQPLRPHAPQRRRAPLEPDVRRDDGCCSKPGIARRRGRLRLRRAAHATGTARRRDRRACNRDRDSRRISV